jgi:hypothetical protein
LLPFAEHAAATMLRGSTSNQGWARRRTYDPQRAMATMQL